MHDRFYVCRYGVVGLPDAQVFSAHCVEEFKTLIGLERGTMLQQKELTGSIGCLMGVKFRGACIVLWMLL